MDRLSDHKHVSICHIFLNQHLNSANLETQRNQTLFVTIVNNVPQMTRLFGWGLPLTTDSFDTDG